MKTLAITAPALLLAIGLFANTHDASAEPVVMKPAGNPIPAAAQLIQTTVKGTLTIPPSYPTVAGVTCANFEVVLASDQMTTRPPGQTGFFIPAPVWQTTVRATGNLASGTCSYSAITRVKKSFYVSVNTNINNTSLCDLLLTAFTPAQAGPFTMDRGTTKVQDFSISSAGVRCYRDDG